jgi:hypothetical protein
MKFEYFYSIYKSPIWRTLKFDFEIRTFSITKKILILSLSQIMFLFLTQLHVALLFAEWYYALHELRVCAFHTREGYV